MVYLQTHWFTFQARQEIAQEYEYVKDINRTLADFKRDQFNTPQPNPAPVVKRDYSEPPTRETRDPDVWPPPTPVERFVEIVENHYYVMVL